MSDQMEGKIDAAELAGADVTATSIDVKNLSSINKVMADPYFNDQILDGRLRIEAKIDSAEVQAYIEKEKDAIRKEFEGLSRPSFAENVVEFNRRVLKIEQRPLGELEQAEYDISVKCLREEIDEFVEARNNHDFVGMIDALIDLKYFADGVLYKMGLTPQTIDKCGQAVHDANMEKKLGVNARRGDGSAADAVKPEGWVAPEARIAGILDEQCGCTMPIDDQAWSSPA